MVVPRSYIERYTKALNLANEQSRAALVEALAAIDYTADVEDIREAVILVMQAACGASTTVAARLSAEFYDGLRYLSVGERLGAIAESGRDPDATTGAIRAFVQLIVDGEPIEDFIALCASRIDYENKRAANECIVNNAMRDPLQPKWARVPTGDETCEYCIMLASRGFVYGSLELASHAHENCDCRIIPGWGRSSKVEGYDADDYFDEYLKIAAKFGAGHTRSTSGKKPNRMIGSGSRFDGVNAMNDYLRESKTLDELYERADIVFKDFKKYWQDDLYGSRSMFNSLSNTAKKMRKVLS